MVQLQRCHPYEEITSIVLEDSDVRVGICLECLRASLSSSVEWFHMEDLDSVMVLEFPVFGTGIHINFCCYNLPNCDILLKK